MVPDPEIGANEGSNREFEEVFDSLINDLREEILSLQLTDFGDINHLYGTTGECSENMKKEDDFSEDTRLKSLEYNGQKYIFMRSITDNMQTSLIFISVDEDSRGRKRGMLLTSFCGLLKLIGTFDYQNANSVTAKVFKVLEQYSYEEEE